MTEIAIVGVGGQGRECLDVAEAMAAHGADLKVVGFFDSRPSAENVERLATRGYEVLGGFADALVSGFVLCLGIGDGKARQRLDSELLANGVESPVLIHPDSTIGSGVSIAPGSVIFAGARLTTNISVGRHVHLNQNTTVGHDSVLDDYATVNPNAAISGSCQIGRAATVGAGGVVLQGRRVGARAVVGASACVTRDVVQGKTVVGVPARTMDN